MASQRGHSRRAFIRAGIGGLAGVSLLAACAPAAPATKPAETKPAASTAPAAAAPAKPAEAAKPAAPAATTAPAAAVPAKPAEAPKPAAATARPDEKIGRNLIGNLEGPTIVADAAQLPKSFNEAPALAELVKASKLPPVAQRIPQEPLVLKPVQDVGKYGGTWRRGFTGPADDENGNRIASTDKVLFWDFSGTKVAASVARDWKISDDGRTTTIFLRKGMKWSDGQPFGADDFVFWFQDIYQDKNLVPTPTAEFAINGKPGVIEKVDDLTVVYKFPDPYYLFVDVLAGDTNIGRGQAVGQGKGRMMGGYAPAHYLKQFLPKYTPQAELDKQAQAGGFDNWVNLLKDRMDWTLNLELPVLAPWVTTTPITKPTWVLERNPYYWAVDAVGNQLPYLDKIIMTLAENLEVLNVRAAAGEYDLQERHVDMAKVPVFLENQQRSGYTLRLDPAQNGTDTALHINQTFDADPEIAGWLQNRDFRRALSLGIDRDQLNETFWLGVGTIGSAVPDDASPYNPGPEWRAKWSTLDVKQANELLDKIGLTQKDAEGFRLRKDGKGRLRLEMTTIAAAFVPFTQHAEMIATHWRKIGIQGDVKEQERSLAVRRSVANETQIFLWSNGGTELLYLYPQLALPVSPTGAYMGQLWAMWYASNGAQGKKPEDPQMLKALELFGSAGGLKEAERIKTAQEIWKILVEEQWSIGTVGISPAFLGVRLASNKLGNIPARQANAQHCRTPGSSHPSTFFFKA